MKRILIEGWCLPEYPRDGASVFVRNLAEYYRSLGHYVEIFTVARPDKVKPWLNSPTPWSLHSIPYNGVTHNLLVREWGILHTDPRDPLRSVRDAKTSQIWSDFLEKSGEWDVVHFNGVSPLELVEIAKKAVPLIRCSLHNFYMLFPHEHLFSYRKYRDNSFQDLTMYELTGEAAIGEYEALGVLKDLGWCERSELQSKFEERIEYGKYLLSEIIDETLGASPPYLAFARDKFEIPSCKLTMTDFAYANIAGAHGLDLQGFQKRLRKAEYAYDRFLRKLQRRSKLIFGVYANLARHKGQHIIMRAIEGLEDYRGRFEVRFYGHTDYDPEYMNLLLKILDRSPFVRDHVRLMGGYRLDQLSEITEDMLVTLGCSSTSTGGSGGGVYETLIEGNLPIFILDYTLRNEVKALRNRCYPSDRQSLRLTYRCGDSWGLTELMKSLIEGEIDLDKAYGRALYMFLSGNTTASSFRDVWAL